MGDGVEAVIREINRYCAPPEIFQRTVHNVGTHLKFVGKRSFEIFVTKAFDDNYRSGSSVKLDGFRMALEASEDGTITVHYQSIVSGIRTD